MIQNRITLRLLIKKCKGTENQGVSQISPSLICCLEAVLPTAYVGKVNVFGSKADEPCYHPLENPAITAINKSTRKI